MTDRTELAGPAALPQLPWHKPPRRRRTPKAPLTRDRIVAAAIEILDRDGLDAVSTRRVAEALDTGSASLYAHVASRDELLELVVDKIAADIEVPGPDPARWQQQLRDYARHALRVWAGHADVTRASLATIPTGPERLRITERLLAILRAAGFTGQDASWAVDRLQLYIDADAYEGWLHVVQGRRGAEPAGHMAAIRDYYRQLPADRYPLVSAMAGIIMTGDGSERFEFGLDLLIAGLAARLAGRRS